MRFDEKRPPREFEAGIVQKVTLRDCGAIFLEPDELVSFHTESGTEYDVGRKEWGYYATPSTNSRLKHFKLRACLVENPQGNVFVLLVEQGKEASFEGYLKGQGMRLICRLDEDTDLDKLKKAFA